MKQRWLVLGLIPLLAAAATVMPGVANPQRAHLNWMMHCQGCHRADASGSAGGAPNMAGEVARFLSVAGGRDYLMRVPGVAHAGLSDQELAELLNWTLHAFDATHVPNDFVPFSAREVGAARKQPLITEAAETRAQLMARFSTQTPRAAAPESEDGH
ncbi:MAG: cytochrome C [Pseudomonadota bacterium]